MLKETFNQPVIDDVNAILVYDLHRCGRSQDFIHKTSKCS